jgi:hypothetical protein
VCPCRLPAREPRKSISECDGRIRQTRHSQALRAGSFAASVPSSAPLLPAKRVLRSSCLRGSAARVDKTGWGSERAARGMSPDAARPAFPGRPGTIARRTQRCVPRVVVKLRLAVPGAACKSPPNWPHVTSFRSAKLFRVQLSCFPPPFTRVRSWRLDS